MDTAGKGCGGAAADSIGDTRNARTQPLRVFNLVPRSGSAFSFCRSSRPHYPAGISCRIGQYARNNCPAITIAEHNRHACGEPAVPTMPDADLLPLYVPRQSVAVVPPLHNAKEFLATCRRCCAPAESPLPHLNWQAWTLLPWAVGSLLYLAYVLLGCIQSPEARPPIQPRHVRLAG